MAIKFVHKRIDIGWTEAMHNQFTANPRVIRRLLTDRAYLEFVKAWHNYGKKADKASQPQTKQPTNAPGITPGGRLALEAAIQAMRGFTWETFLAEAKKMVSGPRPPNKNAS